MIKDSRPLVSSVQTNPTIVPIGESPMAQRVVNNVLMYDSLNNPKEDFAYDCIR